VDICRVLRGGPKVQTSLRLGDLISDVLPTGMLNKPKDSLRNTNPLMSFTWQHLVRMASCMRTVADCVP
jgi:hypothetical protein